jgi:hypothetical protein
MGRLRVEQEPELALKLSQRHELQVATWTQRVLIGLA